MKQILRVPTSATKRQPGMAQESGLEEMIRERAYELYEQRGHEDGHELEDWLQAEAEVKQTSAAA